MKIIKGNLITLAQKGSFDVIMHGCNCFCTMGAGIAKEIKLKFPEAYQTDLETEKGSKEKLGTCSYIEINNLTIVNAYTQFHWRGRGIKVDYEAIKLCFQFIKKQFHGQRIGIPKIGTGLAGGDWNIISKIIKETTENEDITLVEYQP
jgi:O-acetyl-ADP-ribose deacetylase (regulator of RNase III)